MAARWGPWPAVAAASAWVFQPNLFGHGHYAAYDAVLTSLWVLAIVAFARATSGARSGGRDIGAAIAVLGFGMAVGCAMATKLTGWFLPLPFLAWAALFRDRRTFRVLAIGLALAIVLLFLLNPPWWTEPVAGVSRFLWSNLTRGKTRPIPVQFLGTVYQTPNESLPWYNTLVWTVMVTPVGFLLLALAGIVGVLWRWNAKPVGLLILAHWVLLMALRAMPHTPGHDGVRLFLPAFGVLALLAALGARRVLDHFGRPARLAVGAAVIEGVASVLLMMPVPLSYFSPVVGGLPGAVRLGMEPTYYWDGLTDEARSWLRANTGPGQTIQFATFPTSWHYLREIGELPRVRSRLDPGLPAWFVIQNRPGAWLEGDRAIVERSTPAYTVTKFGVPLVWVFPYGLAR
jgi:4-amino-4-deoxy-L-arabinose transferase-like glycosyltransferase